MSSYRSQLEGVYDQLQTLKDSLTLEQTRLQSTLAQSEDLLSLTRSLQDTVVKLLSSLSKPSESREVGNATPITVVSEPEETWIAGQRIVWREVRVKSSLPASTRKEP